jgi:hypothetical protein
MESLLSDKRIIVAKDLMFGVNTLSELGDEIVSIIDYNEKSYLDTIYQFIIRQGLNKSPREEWLKRYNFLSLSKLWATEFNRLFKTNFQLIFFMNHIPRAKECKIF